MIFTWSEWANLLLSKISEPYILIHVRHRLCPIAKWERRGTFADPDNPFKRHFGLNQPGA